MFTDIGSVICASWIFATTSVSAVAMARALEKHRVVGGSWARTGHSLEQRHVLVVRPCSGSEPQLAACLGSILDSKFSFQATVVFALASTEDEATHTVNRVCDRVARSGYHARIAITNAHGPNRKADQIAHVVNSLNSDVDAIVIADSNVDLSLFDLDALVRPLFDQPDLAACWACPFETGHLVTVGDRASRAVLNGSLQSFPLLASIDAKTMVGKLIAIAPSHLATAGGFSPLRYYLGEDMELARRFRNASSRTAKIHACVPARTMNRTVLDTIRRYARWLTVIREQRAPLIATYPLLLCAWPLQVALTFLLVFPAHQTFALSLIGVTSLTRLGVAISARQCTQRNATFLSAVIDTVLADAVLLAAFLRVLVVRPVTWRGHVLDFDARGRVVTPQETARTVQSNRMA